MLIAHRPKAQPLAHSARPRPAWRRAWPAVALLVALLAPLAATVVQASGPVFQVLDINSAPLHTGSAFADTAPPANPRQAAPGMAITLSITPTVYFAASDGVKGRELFKSQGTALSTSLVKNINPNASGAASSDPADLKNLNGRLVFTANDGLYGDELWQSNGTLTGTVMLADITGNASSASPAGLQLAGPAVYFAANDGAHGRELWEALLVTLFLPVVQR